MAKTSRPSMPTKSRSSAAFSRPSRSSRRVPGVLKMEPRMLPLQAGVHPGEHVVQGAHGVEEPDVLEGAADAHLRPPVRLEASSRPCSRKRKVRRSAR